MDVLYPGVDEVLLTTFNMLAHSVYAPMEQTCCGQPAFNIGHLRRFSRMG